jgi:uncharacterized protein (DUF1800 family)
MPVNPGASLSQSEVRHLLRRAGFGPDQRTFDLLEGGTRGAAADYLLTFKPKAFKPGGRTLEQLHGKWIKFILKSKAPLQAKLALFWHDHFAVGFAKVQSTYHMARYIATLHLYAKGNFKDFVKTMNRTGAMMEFLDTVRNDAPIPNENYARELLELFTLGVKDYAAPPEDNYTQDDIVQIARAFTGWRYDDRSRAFLDDFYHDYTADYPARGPKTIFQSTGGFGAAGRAFDDQGEGAQEIDRVVDILFDHTDSTGKNTVARRTAYRLCEFLAHPSPDLTDFVDDVVTDSGFATTWDIGALVRSILCHDDFYLSAGADYSAVGKKSVKWPVDYVVSTLRLVKMKPKGGFYQILGGTYSGIIDHLGNMGQTIGDPPSVFGWDWEGGWVSSATLLARCTFARDLVAWRGGSGFRPEKLMNISLTDPDAIIDAAAAILGIQDHLTAADKTSLRAYLTDGGANPTLDLFDYDTRNLKLHGLFALIMQSPAYQLH